MHKVWDPEVKDWVAPDATRVFEWVDEQGRQQGLLSVKDDFLLVIVDDDYYTGSIRDMEQLRGLYKALGRMLASKGSETP